jgi:anti-anti-sigma factor
MRKERPAPALVPDPRLLSHLGEADGGRAVAPAERGFHYPHVRALGSLLRSLADAGRGERFAVDCRALKAPTAAALGMLVALHKDLRRQGRQLVLTNVPPGACDVFGVTGLTNLLAVHAGGADDLP